MIVLVPLSMVRNITCYAIILSYCSFFFNVSKSVQPDPGNKVTVTMPANAGTKRFNAIDYCPVAKSYLFTFNPDFGSMEERNKR